MIILTCGSYDPYVAGVGCIGNGCSEVIRLIFTWDMIIQSMDELTTLEEYLQLLNKTIKNNICTDGVRTPCGCGFIHGMLYICNYHKSQLILNTHLWIN